MKYDSLPFFFFFNNLIGRDEGIWTLDDSCGDVISIVYRQKINFLGLLHI